MAKRTRKQGLTSRDFADLRDLELIHHELCNYGEQYDHYENKYSYECFNDGYSYKTPPTLNQAIKRQTKTKKSKTLINQNKPERRPEHIIFKGQKYTNISTPHNTYSKKNKEFANKVKEKWRAKGYKVISKSRIGRYGVPVYEVFLGPKNSPSKKAGRVIKASTRQTGKSAKVDKSRKAMSPGKRESSSGRIYYEYRKNRTDVWGGI